MAIQALEHIRPMRGGAQSHLMRASDGHCYVVKFQNNPQHPRVLANELITVRLARGLGLPVPETALVDVSASLIEKSPALTLKIAGREVPCASGLQFGSRLATDDPEMPIYDYLPECGLALIDNLNDFAGIMLFDKWTCNCNGRQMVFCRPRPRQRLRAFMIDQGFCFNAGEWSFPDSPLRGVFCRNVVYRGIVGWESFEPWLSRLESYPPEAVFAAGDEVPPNWHESWDDLQRLLDKLVHRRALVRDLIWAVRNSPRAPFENWTAESVHMAVGAE